MEDQRYVGCKIEWNTPNSMLATQLSQIKDLTLVETNSYIDMADLQGVYDQLFAISMGWVSS